MYSHIIPYHIISLFYIILFVVAQTCFAPLICLVTEEGRAGLSNYCKHYEKKNIKVCFSPQLVKEQIIMSPGA